MKWCTMVIGLLLTAAVMHPAEAQDDGKISGYMFGDYYYVAKASGSSIGAVKGATAKKNNGFAFRRIYFEYNKKLNTEFAMRLRFEAADAGFGSGSKMVPFVKHAYLKFNRSRHTVYIGLSGTPTWSVSEKAWGYRSIEKTLLDLRGIGSSADLGFAYQGKLDEAGKTTVFVMFGNGPGQKPEKDNHKKLYLQLAAKPTGALSLVGYIDWEGQPSSKDKITVAAFIGFQQSKFSGGLEGFLRVNKKAAATKNVQVRGVSLFGAIKASPQVSVFGRVDLFDPSDQITKDRQYLIIGGIDLLPLKDIHIMPNIWVQSYQTSGKDPDIVPRVTFYYKF